MEGRGGGREGRGWGWERAREGHREEGPHPQRQTTDQKLEVVGAREGAVGDEGWGGCWEGGCDGGGECADPSSRPKIRELSRAADTQETIMRNMLLSNHKEVQV